MKKIIAITAVLLTVGIIGMHTAGAAPDWNRGYMYDNAYHGDDFGPGHMKAAVDTENRQAWGPGYCFTDEAQHRGFRHHMTDYGPMHWNGYRR